jgi:hypothetical protein
MRLFYPLGVLVLFALALVACGTGNTSLPRLETELPDVVQAALATSPPEPVMTVPAVVKVAAPLSTVEPTRERPCCYPGCHTYPSTPAPTGVHP